MNADALDLCWISEKRGTRAARFFVLLALILRSGLIWFSHHLVSRILRVSSAKFPVAFVRILGSQGRPWPVKLTSGFEGVSLFSPYWSLESVHKWRMWNSHIILPVVLRNSLNSRKKKCSNIFIIKLGSFHYQKFWNRVCINHFHFCLFFLLFLKSELLLFVVKFPFLAYYCFWNEACNEQSMFAGTKSTEMEAAERLSTSFLTCLFNHCFR